jgi:hypothetical protein
VSSFSPNGSQWELFPNCRFGFHIRITDANFTKRFGAKRWGVSPDFRSNVSTAFGDV